MIELLFCCIKQTLKLRHFFGATENVVRIQIAVALIAFVLIKLAHVSQTAIAGLTAFARLIRANVLHRLRIDRLGPTNQQNEKPQTNPRQAWLLAA